MLITAGHLIAATLWSAGIAQQKTLGEKRLKRALSAVSNARISFRFVRENWCNRLIFLSSKNGHSGAKPLF
ncbi:MAG: hypothetical protein WCC41_21635 [Rhodomicrobium sp.]